MDAQQQRNACRLVDADLVNYAGFPLRPCAIGKGEDAAGLLIADLPVLKQAHDRTCAGFSLFRCHVHVSVSWLSFMPPPPSN